MLPEYQTFVKVHDEALSYLDKSFKSEKPLLVSKNMDEIDVPHRVIAGIECSQYEVYFDGSEEAEYVSFFDRRSFFFCFCCLPDLTHTDGTIFSFKECIKLSSDLRDGPDVVDNFFNELYMHALELSQYYGLLNSPHLNSKERSVISHVLEACEKATWELTKTHAPSIEEVSSDTAYVAYFLEDWFYHDRSFKGSFKYLADNYNTMRIEHDAKMFGLLNTFPRKVYRDLWIVELPINLVEQFFLEGAESRVLNTKRFPTHVELEIAKALMSDSMCIEDAVETSMAL